MRKVKVFLLTLVAGLFLTTTAMASTPDLSPENNLRSEIVKLIDHPSVDIIDGKTEIANLRLMVNNENELIVLDTGTNNRQLDRYIKAKLNYKKVDTEEINHFKSYFLKVQFCCK
jgi:hypothetical protein